MLIIVLWLKTLKILKVLSLKFLIELELLSMRIFLVKVTLKIGQEKYVLKTNFWTFKIKDLIGEKIIEGFYTTELLQSIL